ncbi:AMP-binding protein [Frankia sp. CiP3]|uniref:AMP-binding protein n=1 Tax=Frankia sp. CiP3 TaxID=2880971 RepID=UPI001EF59E31|nr:AMP-binding protein [Frankia sp. CiP3]
MSGPPNRPTADAARVTAPACRLPAIVDAMPARTTSTIFCRRSGKLVGVSYPDCHRDATVLAAALQARGVRPGNRVAIHGASSYEWLLADLACLITGAISVALYPSAPPGRVLGTVRDSRCRLVFTDQAASAAAFTDAGLDVLLLAEASAAAGVPAVGDLLAKSTKVTGSTTADLTAVRRGAEPFTIVSTSGTLSEPKLFAVHSEPLLFTMDRFAEIYGFDGRDRLLLYLPLSHLPQRMMLYWGLDAGLDFILSEPAHFAADGAVLNPTLHVAVPRSLSHLAWRVGETLRRDPTGTLTREAACRAAFGDAIKMVFVGSAPSEPAVLDALEVGGVPVCEVYGTTELGMIGLNTPEATRHGTVGRPIPWGDVRLDPQTSEILVYTPAPFLYGRLVDGEIEVVAHDRQAWHGTGDVGEFDEDGFLSVLGRLRDFLALPSGEKVFVRPIEEAAVRATGAEVAVVTQYEPGRLGALLFFDPTRSDFGTDEMARKHCRTKLDEMNAVLHPWERVRSFAVVEALPSIEEGTVTETTKLRRHKIDEIHGRSATWHRVHSG